MTDEPFGNIIAYRVRVDDNTMFGCHGLCYVCPCSKSKMRKPEDLSFTQKTKKQNVRIDVAKASGIHVDSSLEEFRIMSSTLRVSAWRQSLVRIIMGINGFSG
jgi:hypothetical protein